jgi:hypothetical protein
MNITVRKGMPAKHRPTPPCLPENVLRLARPPNGRVLFDKNGEFIDSIARWRLPAHVDQDDLPAIRSAVDQLNVFLETSDPREVANPVYALLLHYKDARQLSKEEEMSLAGDWIEDMSDYPAWAVADACRSWRRTRKWPPKPCEIIELCETAIAQHRDVRDRLVEILQVHGRKK